MEKSHKNLKIWRKKQIKNEKDKKTRWFDGFTLIDVLVGISLALIFLVGIFGAYQLSLKVIGLSKNKIIATAIANQRIEMVRNLPYESIGIEGGYPDGVLKAEETVTRNKTEYKIENRVDFVADPTDGIASPEDECPNDYKRVEIKVSWKGIFGREIKLITDVVPKNLAQECAIRGGVLSVFVFDSKGIMVPSPLIEVKNPSTLETIKTATPDDGHHYFSLEASTYKVIVSKDGYSLKETFGVGDTYNGKTIVTPEKPHPIVLEGELTEISFSIDKLSSMKVETRGTKEVGYPIIHDVTFSLTGEKKVGLDENEDPIYKYSQNRTTNGTGEVEISNLEWDSYYFSIVSPDLDLVSIESPPGNETEQPIDLAPNEEIEVRLILKAENYLLLTVEDKETSEPIFSAKVTLSNAALGYEKIQYTDEKGQTYFIPLNEGNYDLSVEAAGYESVSTNISVLGDTTKEIQLEEIE